jgi:hypothetical protein
MASSVCNGLLRKTNYQIMPHAWAMQYGAIVQLVLINVTHVDCIAGATSWQLTTVMHSGKLQTTATEQPAQQLCTF